MSDYPVPETSSMSPFKKYHRKTINVMLLEVYAKYKRQFLNPGVHKVIWRKIAHEMKEKSFRYGELHWQNKIADLRREYERTKDKPTTNEELVAFKIAAKNAFQTIENPVTSSRDKVKMATLQKKLLKRDRLFVRNMTLLTVYALHKDEFTFHADVESVWKKIAENMNRKFPHCPCRPAQCRDKVLFFKKQYEKMKDKNSEEVTSTRDAVFLEKAKLAFETKENPVTFIDNQKKEKKLASLKAFNMYKVQFLSPDADHDELWQKIVEAEQKFSLRNKPYSVPDLRNHMRYLKSKYDKLKNSKIHITTPEDAIFFEEAKLVFERTGSEVISVDQILHDKLSDKSKEKFERRLALLRAYNIYKAEFSSPTEDDDSVWEKISGTVRISCSLNRFSVNDCRLQLFKMKEKYERRKRHWSLAVDSRPEGDILYEEEKLAFETVVYSEEDEQMDLLTERDSDDD